MRSRLLIALEALAIGVLILIAFTIIIQPLTSDASSRDEPAVTTTYYAEKSGPNATGRVCSQTLVTVPGDVAVAVDCDFKPVENRVGRALGLTP